MGADAREGVNGLATGASCAMTNPCNMSLMNGMIKQAGRCRSSQVYAALMIAWTSGLRTSAMGLSRASTMRPTNVSGKKIRPQVDDVATHPQGSQVQGDVLQGAGVDGARTKLSAKLDSCATGSPLWASSTVHPALTVMLSTMNRASSGVENEEVASTNGMGLALQDSRYWPTQS